MLRSRLLIGTSALVLALCELVYAEEVLVADEQETESWTPGVTGSMWYAYVAPDEAPIADRTSILDRISLQFSDRYGDGSVGYDIDLEHRPGKLGGYPTETWIDSAYAVFDTPVGTFKAGSVYTPFGPLWDHTYYGSLLYYKGYRHDADYGLLYENKHSFADGATLDTSLAYLATEDGLNGATIIGQGHEHGDAREHDTLAFQLSPSWEYTDSSKLTLGLSGLTGQIEGANADTQLAMELHAIYSHGPLTLTAEYVYYDQASGDDATLRGSIFCGEIHWELYQNDNGRFAKSVAFNYSFSEDNPDSGTGLGQLHIPAISVKFTDNMKLDIMRVGWQSGDTELDKSWRTMFYLCF